MSEIDDAKAFATMGELLLQCDDGDAEMAAFACFGAAAEPLVKRQKQNIGDELLSLARLKREAAQRGLDGDDMSRNVYQRFGFRLSDLPVVVSAFQMPAEIKTRGRYVFSGEEAVLLLLRRFRSTCPLLELTEETGRSISAISEIITWTVEYIRER